MLRKAPNDQPFTVQNHLKYAHLFRWESKTLAESGAKCQSRLAGVAKTFLGKVMTTTITGIRLQDDIGTISSS
jgi:hypothetical protein